MGRLHTLRSRRRSLDISQTELAARAGCHLNTIHRIECGQSIPDLPLAGRVAAALATDVVALFPELLLPNDEQAKAS